MESCLPLNNCNMNLSILIFIVFISVIFNFVSANIWAPVVNLPAGTSGITYTSSLWISSTQSLIAGNKGTLVDGSVILSSSNKGVSWSSSTLTSGSFGTVTALTQNIVSGTVYFLSVGYQLSNSVGRVLLSKNSNGSVWSIAATTYLDQSSISQSLPELYSVCLGRNGYAYTAGKPTATLFSIYVATSVSGTYSQWSVSQSWTDTSFTAYGMATYDGVNVVVVGSHTSNVTFLNTGTIFRSSDMGSSWSVTYISQSTSLYTAAAISSSTFYIGGSSGYIARSTDSGITWIVISYSNVNYAFFSISLLSSSDVYVAGYNSDSTSAQGLVLKSTDSGATWGTEVMDLKSTTTVAMYDVETGLAGDTSIYAKVTGSIFLELNKREYGTNIFFYRSFKSANSPANS